MAPTRSPQLRRLGALGLSLLFAAALAACGGGDDTADESQAAAETSSAAALMVPADTSEAMTLGVSTAEGVIASGDASTTVACPGGGSATYTEAGPDAATLNNRRFDTGELFTVTYTDCRGETGAASVNGVQRLLVTSAAANELVFASETDAVVVSLPRGSVTLNGASTVTRTVETVGSATTTTWRMQTPQYTAAIVGPVRTRTYTLTNVDIVRSRTVEGTAVTLRSGDTELTLSGDLPNVSFAFSVASESTIVYGADGLPTLGHWAMAPPNNAIDVTVDGGIATIEVDRGNDGTIDATYTVEIGELRGRLD